MERSAIVSKRVQEGWARDPQMGEGPADGRGTCRWAGSGDGSGRGQESFPGTVAGILQRHGDPRVGRWSDRIAQEFHAGLSWRTPPLFAVATHT